MRKSGTFIAAVGMLLLAACTSHTAAPVAAAPRLNALTREAFNRGAVEHFLPLFWREDSNGDGELQRAELAVLWGYPDSDAALWIDPQGGFTARLYAAYALLSGPAAAAAAPTHRQALVLQDLRQGAPTLVYSDLSKDSPAEREMVTHLMAAARLIERLYARQKGVLGMDSGIAADDAASRALFHRNQGPYCEAPLTEKDPECAAVAPRPAKRVGLYPPDIQVTPGFCQRMEKAPNAAELQEHFSIVTAGATPGSLVGVPYSLAWREDMQGTAAELDAAAIALGTAEAPLSAYLHAAAAAFRTNDWEPADRAWKAMNAQNSHWYVRAAPDEVYFDPCAWKAGFALQLARINPDSVAWRERLEPLKAVARWL